MNPLPFILLAITLPLLLGGCGEKEEPVAEVKPESDSVNAEELEERESIMYLKDSETPYTGKSFRSHSNGQKMSEGNWKDGKRNGLFVVWHENGQKEGEGNWKDDKSIGLHVSWYKNEQKESEGNYKDDKPIGLHVSWHENGQKGIEKNYKDGKEEGLETQWHENGQKLAEQNWKDGEKISAKYWNSKGEPVDSEEEAEPE